MKQVKEPVYIIIPVHNRKSTTLKCLETLKSNGDLGRYYVVVVDDGSIDGSSEAITEQYPDVIILQGDGNLWWTGAINLGMKYAHENGAKCIVWLNDDTLPVSGAVPLLVQKCHNLSPCILSGQSYESGDLQVKTYGGQLRGLWNHYKVQANPNEFIECDSTGGNLVCLPIKVIDDIGYLPSQKLPHYQADVVYTWKAKRSGYSVAVVGSAISICPFNSSNSSWLLGSVSSQEIWYSFTSPKSPFYYKGYWNFCLEFWGLWGIIVFLKPYIRLMLITLLRWVFPLHFLKFLKEIQAYK